MSAATDHALTIVNASVLDDDDFGYPPQLAFVASDRPGWQRLLWRNLTEERVATTVVDGNGSETLFTPVPGRPGSALARRLLRRARVRVQSRHSLAHHAPGPERVTTIRLSRLHTLGATAPHVDLSAEAHAGTATIVRH